MDSGNEERWRALMMAAQDGDRLAYNRLLHDIVPFIRAMALRQNCNSEWLEDVVQDVLLTIHRVRHTYDPNRPFKPWLATIAQRRSIDIFRRRRRLAAYETSNDKAYETFPDPAANRAMEVRVAAEGVREGIAELPQRQRQAVELLKLREMSLAEAAKVSGRPVGALKVNLHRAIKSLRARLVGE